MKKSPKCESVLEPRFRPGEGCIRGARNAKRSTKNEGKGGKETHYQKMMRRGDARVV